MKDQLERSKYDEDNSYHGLPEGSRPKVKSSTAKRYTAAGGGPSTGPAPGWATGAAAFTRGFAHQAHNAPPPRNPGTHRPDYNDFTGTGSPYGGARKQRSGYGYSENFARPAQPPPQPAPPPKPTAADFESDFEYPSYYGSYGESPRARESAYARTSQRQSNTTPTGNPMPKASTRRAHSTVGGTRDPGAQGPDFNIGAYIKERRAREEEQARRDEEAARQREEDRRREEEIHRSQRAARKEEQHRAREYESRRRAEEDLRREAEIAEETRRVEEEARRAQEEARRRNAWDQQESSQYPRNDFARPDPSFPGGVAEDDLLRTVDERLAEGYRKSKSTFGTTPRNHSRKSPTKSKVRKDGEWSAPNGYSEWSKSGDHSDNSGSQNHFTSAEEGDAGLSYVEKLQKRERERKAAEERANDSDAGLSYVEKLQKRERERKAAEEREEKHKEQQEQQRKWEDMLRGENNKTNHGHGRTKSETQPRDRPSTPDRPRTSGQDIPSSASASKRASPSIESSNKKRRNSVRQNSSDFKYIPPSGVFCAD